MATICPGVNMVMLSGFVILAYRDSFRAIKSFYYNDITFKVPITALVGRASSIHENVTWEVIIRLRIFLDSQARYNEHNT